VTDQSPSVSAAPTFIKFYILLLLLVAMAEITINDILLTLENHRIFHPDGIGYGLYTATCRFWSLAGTATLGDLGVGPQTHFHLRYLLLGGSSMSI
jgi:hypothetical protein